MNDTAKKITETKEKINKLKKDFSKGVPKGMSFTVTVFYGGNKEPDVNRVVIGSLYDEDTAGQELYNLIMRGLEASLRYWMDAAEKEVDELNRARLL